MLSVMACGRSVAPEFQTYLTDFEADAKRFGRDVNTDSISISFGDTGSPNNGAICHTGSKEIIVQKALWDVDDDTERKIIVYHELGHCVLGLDHSTELGIMYPSRVPEVVYKLNPDSFLTKFFEVK
jgi:hypothetical protein